MWTFEPHDWFLVACLPSVIFVFVWAIRASWPWSGVAVPSASKLGSRPPRSVARVADPRGTAARPELTALDAGERTEIDLLVDALLRSERRPRRDGLAAIKPASKWVM